MGEPGSGWHVFICYSRDDSARVDDLERALRAAGIPVWRDSAQLWPGQDWRARIHQAITSGALFLACFSSRSVARRVAYQNEELMLAVEQARLRRVGDTWLIPVRFDDCVLPDLDLGGGRRLAGIQCADLFGDEEGTAVGRLVAAITRIHSMETGTGAVPGPEAAGPAGVSARQAAPGVLVSRPVSHWEPVRLGVHPAIAAPGGAQDPLDLPAYVERSHDLRLRDLMDTRGRDTVILLVGGSMTGKTRAAVECLRAVAAAWELVRPVDAGDLASVCEPGRIGPRTVIWLDEIQAYMYERDGPDAAKALRGLLDRGIGVVVIGTLWPQHFDVLTESPSHGEADPYRHVRELFSGASIVRVPESFSEDPAELRRLDELSKQDSRLAAARAAAGDERAVVQVLGGGPSLVARYEHDLDPPCKAIVTAAMDVSRLGYRTVVPPDLLEQAADGYLTGAQRARLGKAWFDSALSKAVRAGGGLAALQAIRARPGAGPADGYRIADYLDQHGRLTRQDKLIPASTWDALASHTTNSGDLSRLAAAAENRRLYRHAVLFARPAAAAGDIESADLLRRRMKAAGHGDDVLNVLREAATTGVVPAMMALARELESRRNGEDPELWWGRAAEAGDPFAMWRLARLLGGEGRYAGNQIMRDRQFADAAEKMAREQQCRLWMERAAEAGDSWAVFEVADQIKQEGRQAEAERLLRRAADAGDTAAMLHLARWLPAPEAEDLLRRAAKAGRMDALTDLARRLKRTNRHEQAFQLLSSASREGHWEATRDLVDMLQDSGQDSQALAVLHEAVLTDDSGQALNMLTSMLDCDEAEAALRLAARSGGNRTYATLQLAKWLESDGRPAEMEGVLRAASQAGDFWAMRDLASWLQMDGQLDAAEHWLYRAVGAPVPDAGRMLLRILRERGRDDDEIEEMLRYAIESRYTPAVDELTNLLGQAGRQAEAQRLERFGIEPGGRTCDPW